MDIALPVDAAEIAPRQHLDLTIRRPDGSTETIVVQSRLDTDNEIEYYRAGGILQFVLNKLVAED